LSIAAASTKSIAAMATELQAWLRESLPWGSSRLKVRGLRASKCRSAIRLNAMAAQRAEENARMTNITIRAVTGVVREAATTPSSAKGRAKSVCGSLTRLV
jgi:hypothetical protein